MKKKEEPKDRHLDVPAEANRDKHINFVAEEQGKRNVKSKNTDDLIRNQDPERKQKV